MDVSYLKAYDDDVINTTNNETQLPEPRRVIEESFEIKFQDVYVLKYLNYRILPSCLCFSVD